MAGNDVMDSAFLVATEEFLLEYEASAGLAPEEAQHHGPLVRLRSKQGTPRACPERSRLKAADRRDRYRKKLQNEGETLKRQERELSIELRALEEAAAQAKEEEKKANTLALSAWRATAARQKEKRLEAENQQRQLKAAVAHQAELIRQMNALLLQPTPVDKPLRSLEAEPKSHTLFRNFVGELDSLYTRTNDVMAGVEFMQWPPERFRWALSWNETRIALEGANAAVLPFTIEQITLTMSVLLLSEKTGSHYTGKIDDPDNTAAISYNLHHTLPSGGSASLTIYNALRRYVEAERVVFVWRVLAEGQGEFEGLYANEHAWLTLRPSTDEAGHPTTISESCTQVQILGLDGPVEGGDARGDRFVELLAHADAEDMKEVRQAMQRMLLDNETDDEADVLELKL